MTAAPQQRTEESRNKDLCSHINRRLPVLKNFSFPWSFFSSFGWLVLTFFFLPVVNTSVDFSI